MSACCHVGVLLYSSRISLLEGDEHVTYMNLFMFHGVLFDKTLLCFCGS